MLTHNPYDPKISVKRQRLIQERLEFITTLALDVFSFTSPTIFTINCISKSLLLLFHATNYLKSTQTEPSRDYAQEYNRVKSKYETIRGMLTLPALYIAVTQAARLYDPLLLYLGFRAFVGLACFFPKNREVDWVEEYQYPGP